MSTMEVQVYKNIHNCVLFCIFNIGYKYSVYFVPLDSLICLIYRHHLCTVYHLCTKVARITEEHYFILGEYILMLCIDNRFLTYTAFMGQVSRQKTVPSHIVVYHIITIYRKRSGVVKLSVAKNL